MSIDLGDPCLFHRDRHLEMFRHLREHDPVYLQLNHPRYGTFWNVTRHEDIMRVDLDAATYSAEDSFLLEEADPRFKIPMFLAMDAPRHGVYRDAVKPFFSGPSLRELEQSVRDRAIAIIEALPVDEEFDWVQRMSCELTSQILALMFNFPQEQRDVLVRWSDLVTETGAGDGGAAPSWDERLAGMMDCLRTFTEMKAQRIASPPTPDLLSLLIHGPAAGLLKPSEFLGNVLMLIVAGNDTTRNSITAGVLAFSQHPDQLARLRENPALLDDAVSEIFRWQTPVAYMRRVARVDTELCGKQIRAGDKVVIWHASGNQDETVFPEPERFIIGRDQQRRSLAFGFGIHRCLGARLAAMQLRVVWEELLARFDRVEVAGEPVQVKSNFIKGYASLPVRLRR